jgi:hypothetical protein
MSILYKFQVCKTKGCFTVLQKHRNVIISMLVIFLSQVQPFRLNATLNIISDLCEREEFVLKLAINNVNNALNFSQIEL